MSFVVYGLQKTRITLYQTDGTTPKTRITLQKETKEGLTLSFKPEGQLRQAGSGAAWARNWAHFGFRAQLRILWDLGTDETLIQSWEPSGWGLSSFGESAWSEPDGWGTSAQIPTASALSILINGAYQVPCLVEPHLDKSFSFLAQPDPGRSLDMRDVKGVAHSGMELALVGTNLVEIPDWSTI